MISIKTTSHFVSPRRLRGSSKYLEQTGPLIAPSANLQGQPPAKNIQEAYEYFGDAVDLYVDGGTVESGRAVTSVSGTWWCRGAIALSDAKS